MTTLESRMEDKLYPPFKEYAGQESFFLGEHPLNVSIGWIVVLGFGVVFSIFTTAIVMIDKFFKGNASITSEHFNTAGRMIKTGLTASVIVSQWTWAATLLQSSNVAWQYGVSGPFWYASGATIQVLLFGVLAISLKKVAPSAHTMCEIVRARWGKTAHITFLFFAFAANIIVTSMLLLGGAATVQALTGMDYKLASFFIPWGVILYTSAGGLKATFLASYIHTAIIFAVLITMILVVYIKTYSSDQIYDFLDWTVSYTEDECKMIYSNWTSGESFYEKGKYACGPVSGNAEGSYLTMLSSGGLMFGIINIVGNFGTVFVDQSYWQSAIAARPSSAARGYLLGGLCWFSIPFSLATSLGLASTALLLPITAGEAGSGLVPPAVATHLLGQAGSVLILIMLFMAIVSTGSAESIAVSSLVAYDIYREYFNPEATGRDILKVSRIVIVLFGLIMGALSIALDAMGLNLGWVYLFMGIMIGSAVIPLWNMMTWDKASGKGAVIAAWSGLALALTGWMVGAKIQGGEVTVATLGTNEVMLSGNLIAILSSGLIHYVYSKFIDGETYDFAELDKNIHLVEQDLSGLGVQQQDPDELRRSYRWITRRGWFLTIVLVIIWPLLSVPAGKFTKDYFAFWVLVAICWGFGAAVIIVVLPLAESQEDIGQDLSGLLNFMMCKKGNINEAKYGEDKQVVEEDTAAKGEEVAKDEEAQA
uniref:Urea active transporter n=1 Tax=Trieres chinensis TaxID=1514140 RepID=A0A7S1YU98_TRICV|mmetsp:Transcript_10599/g.22205  ORF Transcript_10599/g.22205 Transcript_10599/m.22205 type:complete len:707 (+) Transcript_10599:66-2186(+)|eukprot:CAMPEP_0183301668 /NCGR_PEP_ID=MMETSP0160_2-20130417/7702_1 /TAXON_ID=2839 ORGANISM="Odontella Sinensis, Strain Grunow 1884" /NCGR_SAMPLE_ID=MMETSP0160_2 /ASSEMBLY_ACC=CAM_ASM_000250 /LENGTH=706 /DNA_ID=CAMNT_0025464321 /DNA_START=56 /DNA_END=2176 /DNA_ORIENTATION=-